MEHYPALGTRLQTVRDSAVRPAWRWPVLDIEQVTAVGSPEDFLDSAAERLAELAIACGAEVDGLHQRLLSAGRAVLEENAGTGYRRPLMKALASLTCEVI
jgi:hypothetical protein